MFKFLTAIGQFCMKRSVMLYPSISLEEDKDTVTAYQTLLGILVLLATGMETFVAMILTPDLTNDLRNLLDLASAPANSLGTALMAGIMVVVLGLTTVYLVAALYTAKHLVGAKRYIIWTFVLFIVSAVPMRYAQEPRILAILAAVSVLFGEIATIGFCPNLPVEPRKDTTNKASKSTKRGA